MRQFIENMFIGAVMTGACIVGAGCCDCKKNSQPASPPPAVLTAPFPAATQPTTRPDTYEHKEHTEDSKTSEPKIVIQ